MKLLRYGPPKSEKPGLLDAEDVIRDLPAHIQDISPETVTPRSLARIAAAGQRVAADRRPP
jgi:2,4-didehydro-3-deoxy-L-rhamnonate hydrolase